MLVLISEIFSQSSELSQIITPCEWGFSRKLRDKSSRDKAMRTGLYERLQTLSAPFGGLKAARQLVFEVTVELKRWKKENSYVFIFKVWPLIFCHIHMYNLYIILTSDKHKDIQLFKYPIHSLRPTSISTFWFSQH